MTHAVETVKERLKREQLYTAYYCEENVFNLVKMLTEQGIASLEDLLVVFVSNANKPVPFWLQAASQEPDGSVVWDYHVVLVQPSGSLAWDLDSSLPCPSDLHRYLRHALRPEIELRPSFAR